MKKQYNNTAFGEYVAIYLQDEERFVVELKNVSRTNQYILSEPSLYDAKAAFIYLDRQACSANKLQRHRLLTYIFKKERSIMLKGGSRC